MLQIVLENISAEQTHLILRAEDGQLYQIAKYEKAQDSIGVFEKVLLQRDEFLPAIIQYVAHARENLTLNNLLENELFRNSPYVRKHNLGLLMVLPLVQQGSLVGIVYLQVRRAGVFHTDTEVDDRPGGDRITELFYDKMQVFGAQPQQEGRCICARAVFVARNSGIYGDVGG